MSKAAIDLLMFFVVIAIVAIVVIKLTLIRLNQKDKNIENHANDRIIFDNYEQIFTINDKTHKTYNYNQIVDFELLENGSTIITIADIRDQFFMGAKSAKMDMCHSLEIKITLRDSDKPSIYVPFIEGRPVKKDSYLYQTIYTGAQNTLSALKLAMDQVADRPQTYSISGADEIMKYKNLLDEGIITQEEFNTKKAQILNKE